MTSVSVIMPWRPGCRWREAALAYLLPRWQKTGWQVVVAAQPDGGPWRKAAAVEAGLADATGDVLVIADADVWCDGITDAVRAVEHGAPWAIPHWLVYRLTRAATEAVYAGGRLDGPTEREPYVGWAGGGMTVLPRATYEQVPLDPRFRGWGGEDAAWAHALTTLAGAAWRGDARLYHLHHPLQPRTHQVWGSLEARDLTRRYARARLDPTAMTNLIEEFRGSR